MHTQEYKKINKSKIKLTTCQENVSSACLSLSGGQTTVSVFFYALKSKLLKPILISIMTRNND